MGQQFDDEVLREMQKRDAWDDGYGAYLNEKYLDANPYDTNDVEWDLYDAWRNGWFDAAWDN